MKKKIIIGTIISLSIVLLGGISVLGYRVYINSQVNKNSSILQSNVYTISDEVNVLFEGQFQPVQKVTYDRDLTKGNVDSVSVAQNQVVKKGDLLFTYKNDDIIQQMDDLKYQLDTLKSTNKKLKAQYTKLKLLVVNTLVPASNSEISDKSNITSQQSIQEIQDQIDDNSSQQLRLQNKIDGLAQKSFSKIAAPFDGIIKLPDVTDKSVLTIEDTNYHIVCYVGEKDILKLSKDEEVSISVYGTDQSIKGKIKLIDNEPANNEISSEGQSAISVNNSLYKVLIETEERVNVYPGFHVQIKAKAVNNDIKVPKTAVFEENNSAYVWIINGDKPKRTLVSVSNWNDKYVLVKSGVSVGEKILREVNKNNMEGINVNGDN